MFRKSGFFTYKARYDACAKKILSFRAIIAWILKCCTKEFSQYTVPFIYDNCLPEAAEISTHAVHQDEKNVNEILNGNQRIDEQNTEANSIKEQTVYYDVRFGAILPEGKEPIRIIINLEIQLDDHPGYPIVKRGFYYCGRMISEQYGIFRYHTVEETIIGTSCTQSDDYDMMEVIILNLGDTNKDGEPEILNLLLAQMMLEDHEPIDKIQKYTGYTIDVLKEIEKMIKKQ